VPLDAAVYTPISQAYVWAQALALVLIVAGVIIFYKARKESGGQTPSPATAGSQ